jgi:hypothetical protein
VPQRALLAGGLARLTATRSPATRHGPGSEARPRPSAGR